MGYLIRMWHETPKNFTMTLKQVVNNAGDGFLSNETAIDELREFFSLIDLHTMERLLGECYLKDKKYKFDTRGFATQDLINEMGRRLGYKVTNGLYRGKRNEIGYDGIWEAPDGSFIVMESKTSDDYTISIDSVIGYRDKLITEHRVPKKKCSILIVYGRDEKNGLSNAAKGSDEGKNIRLISATALFQLVKLVVQSKGDTVQKQVFSLLRPKDYFVLDNLVELVFPQTGDEIPDVEDADNNDLELDSFQSKRSESKSEDYPKQDQEKQNLASVEEILASGKSVGVFVQTDFLQLLNSGFVDNEEIELLTTKDYCNQHFKAKKSVYPMLKEWPDGTEKKDIGYQYGQWRYYSKIVFVCGGKRYLLSSQWYSENFEKLLTWYSSHIK